MYARLSSILFPVFTLLFIGAVVWGYQQNDQRNKVIIKAENQYQRAFHDLSYHMDDLHVQLGNALAVNSASNHFHRKCLMNVWRLTSQAQSEINQLPLYLLPFDKTEEFLANIADFTYKASIRDYAKEPLSPDEMKTLTSLYERSAEISNDFKKVQAHVLENRLKWADAEQTMTVRNSPKDNSIIDGFKKVDKKISEYSEINWGPSVASIAQNRTYQSLGGDQITKQQALDQARKFLGLQDLSMMQVSENGDGTEYSSYSVQYKDDRDISLDFTKKGGHLIWYMDHREIGERAVSPDEATQSAHKFLKEHDYPEMKAVGFDDFGSAANITFARVQDGVIIYPESLVVKVGLDNGDVVGLQATDYVFEHKARSIKKPTMTTEQARKYLNPQFQVKSTGQALIKNEIGKEVLNYEFIGSINGATYKIYINADNGLEEMLERIREGEEIAT